MSETNIKDYKEAISFVKYDEKSPTSLVWTKPIISKTGVKTHKDRVGKPVGSLTSHGYYEVSICCRRYYVHRLVWFYFNKSIPKGLFIDHIDGDKKNNTIKNLRLVNEFESARNISKKSHNTSGETGVMWQTVNGYEYARAQWYSLEGKQECKMFSVKKLGKDKAFQLAKQYRQRMMRKLQKQGAGYTKRHLLGGSCGT